MSELVKVTCRALIRGADIQSSETRRRHDASVAAVWQQHDAQAAQVAYRQNTFAPINKLSLEVLSDTPCFTSRIEFNFVEWRFLRHIKTIKRLAMVERYWLQAVLSTLQIWSTLEDTMSPKQLELASMLKKKSIDRSVPTTVSVLVIRTVTTTMKITFIAPSSLRWSTQLCVPIHFSKEPPL
ncbi:hypothetical protein FRB94_001866 [Tulasnella sp. JGI-2019a]|nr:hypothetical protein FRB94_001866 [Tulasnella sp. JGI-2019a]KAG9017267.1 hypothetical protein FRB93_007380 [Tulasnella sp. JGI-2019a]